MPNKYSSYIEINPLFESVVDIQSDERNKDLWKEYIVGKEMEELVDCLCQSLGREFPDSTRHFWAHGTYGTGKSYAAIFVKHLIEEKPDIISNFLGKSSRLSQYRNRFLKCRKNGDYLFVWKTACTGIKSGDALLVEFEKSIISALKNKFGENAYLGSISLLGGIKSKLNDQTINWNALIKTTTLSDEYDNVDQIKEDIENNDIEAIQAVAKVFIDRGESLVKGTENSTQAFKKWLEDIIEHNNLSQSGIFIVWDEFTEYVRNSSDHTILQQLSEFSKDKKTPFFVMYVVHKSAEMLNSMGEDNYSRIFERFHNVEFHVSQEAAFDLIAGSITTRNAMEEHWAEEKKQVLEHIHPFLADMSDIDEDEDLKKTVSRLCPMHPMTVRLLSRVAESFAASQRTMFRFMKDQADTNVGFAGYIQKYGPEDMECWLTPDWLWDYFFTRESDYSDKEVKASDYINHFNESYPLVEGNEDALRVFKTAMLLLAIMSSTKKLRMGRIRSNSSISATVHCLVNCFAGVIDKDRISDILATLKDSKVLLTDTAANGVVRLQLPFRGSNSEEYNREYEKYEKEKSRYNLFKKDGDFSSIIEEYAWPKDDKMFKRMKICACCAEKLSIENRLKEIQDDLAKNPYKLGVLLVTVQSEQQFIATQSTLVSIASECNPRITIALIKKPFTDDLKKNWLSKYTRWKMALDAGSSSTGAAKDYNSEAETIKNGWIQEAIAGSMMAWNRIHTFNNIFGMAHLRKIIQDNVLFDIFKYAPEKIIETNTAYKPCSDAAALAGVTRESKNTQIPLAPLRSIGILEMTSIKDIVASDTQAISELAQFIRDEMDSGQNVYLDDLWNKLKKPPFGYYDNIACGILLGFIFSCYKDSVYSWTDSAQSSHNLSDNTLKTMVWQMCKGKLTTDYLSAGSVTFQKFRDYAQSIFKLQPSQVSTESSCVQNIRNSITNTGTPFWALKYLDDTSYGGSSFKETAITIIDLFQLFVSTDGARESIMSDVVKSFKGKGKIRDLLSKNFHDKTAVTTAFRNFLFDSSNDLKSIAEELELHPDTLNDKLNKVMQGAIYTWSEDEVKSKLSIVVQEYLFLSALNHAMGKKYFSLENARHDLANVFAHMRISLDAVEKLKEVWYPTMKLLFDVSQYGIGNMTVEQQNDAIHMLSEYGKDAMSRLRDDKPILEKILETRGIECTKSELDKIYTSIKGLSASTQISSFDKEIETQIKEITFSRNKLMLNEQWKFVSGKDTVKQWCTDNCLPLLWLVSKEERNALLTVIAVQNGKAVLNQDVQQAYSILKNINVQILTDFAFASDMFIHILGSEYSDILKSDNTKIMTKAKLELGNDMSNWDSADLNTFRDIVKKIQREKARKEKLNRVKNGIKIMDENQLRNRVVSFLEDHPEFCDSFAE